MFTVDCEELQHIIDITLTKTPTPTGFKAPKEQDKPYPATYIGYISRNSLN